MKKFLFILLFGLVTIISNAQIYNTIRYYDKFDDCIKTEKIKTLINIDLQYDGRIIIETKRKSIKEYYIIDDMFSIYNYGKKDSVVNLVDNIYGYQTNYYCVEKNDIAKFNIFWKNKFDKWENGELQNVTLDELIKLKHNNPYVVCITDRIITTQYTMSYQDRVFWIRKNDGSRIIYTNK